MNLYAESSAVLAWLFREASGGRVEATLLSAEKVYASEITLIECERAIHRGLAVGRLTQDAAQIATEKFRSAAATWSVLSLVSSVAERARQPFPDEPIRTLDALHVAFALQTKLEQPDVALLTLDDRIRRVGKSLGFDIQPN